MDPACHLATLLTILLAKRRKQVTKVMKSLRLISDQGVGAGGTNAGRVPLSRNCWQAEFSGLPILENPRFCMQDIFKRLSFAAETRSPL